MYKQYESLHILQEIFPKLYFNHYTTVFLTKYQREQKEIDYNDTIDNNGRNYVIVLSIFFFHIL